MKNIKLVIALLATPLILTGCGSTTDSETATPSTAETVSEATSTTSADASTSSAVDGDDPVFDIIDVVLAEYPDGIITSIDREDSVDRYDVDVVSGEEIIELEVTPDGQIHIDEREGDDDDIREARTATITAAQAIGLALDQHPEGVLDSAELNEDDGLLEWEIELDNASRHDLTELNIPAN
ncbi:PepSY domain-containing protein [Corynebacterium crudilactis]|uniref:PepSY domain-containing protein n=1 Tax=Corynebacterium crudilactis TaxID=1652495 RepID=A0A172QQB6_9CORY|nr:PepSY domain-containing protein [Corynebacterium crudilactis]ANE02862.1 hypothetical protein ccrud_00555 [Corynebacterium crudilactis]